MSETTNYEPSPGTSINTAVKEAYDAAVAAGSRVILQFNGAQIIIARNQSLNDNILTARKALGLPEVDPPFHPQTAEDALKKWDAGENVFTIEMGGLGPGYEQAIQILAFEIIRDQNGSALPEGETFGNWGDSSVSRIENGKSRFGFSGAQVGAAKQIAFRAIRDGWSAMLDTVPKDRLIQVSKSFPSL